MEVMTEKEIEIVKRSTLYELRLIIDQGNKEEYTKDEIKNLIDQIATAKGQE